MKKRTVPKYRKEEFTFADNFFIGFSKTAVILVVIFVGYAVLQGIGAF